MDYNVHKSILTELIIDRHTMNVIKSYELLNLSTHLSFPVILRIKDDIFVYPENSKSDNSYIYRYNRSTYKLVEHKLLAKFSLTDVILLTIM